MILINSKEQQVINSTDHSHLPSIALPNIDHHIPDIVVCEQLNTADDCKHLIAHMLTCQQIIFNDPGFSYQQYIENMNIHKQILGQYQSLCEGTSNDSLTNDSFEFKKLT